MKTIDDVTVYRAIPSLDGGYSLSAEYNGNGEIASYDRDGVPTTRTYGKTKKDSLKDLKSKYVL